MKVKLFYLFALITCIFVILLHQQSIHSVELRLQDGMMQKERDIDYRIAILAIDANDYLYVADSLNHVIRKITPDGYVTIIAGQKTENGGYQNGAKEWTRFYN